MAADTLLALGVLNLAAAAAVLAVLCLRKFVRRAFGARIAYGLWFLVPLAAGATLLPARRIALTVDPITAADVPYSTSAAAPMLDLSLVGLAVWIAGAAAGVAFLLLRQSHSVKRLGRLSPEPKAGVWRAENPAVGPAVIGLIAPRIVLPADFDTRFDADEQVVVLAHESHHLAAHDARINALVSLVQCLCWFNPLMHLAAARFRADQELACDETVLARYPDRRRTYAEALLKTQLSAAPLPLGCYWPARTASPLRERITMLKQSLPGRSRRFAGAGLVLTLAACASAAAWAAQPPEYVLRPAARANASPALPFIEPVDVVGHAALHPASTAIQPPAAPLASPPEPSAPTTSGARERFDFSESFAEAFKGFEAFKFEMPGWTAGDGRTFSFDSDAFAAGYRGVEQFTPEQREQIRAQAMAAAEQARASTEQAREIARRQAEIAARARSQDFRGRPDFPAITSPERARAMAELSELMKPSAAELERQRQIAELSKPTPEEQERLRRLRELRAQQLPEEIERRRKLNEKMRELGFNGPAFIAPPPPPAPPAPPRPVPPAPPAPPTPPAFR